MQVKEGAKTFLLEGNNRKAVLLIHGYTGTPSEMLPLGEYLNKLGYTVLCRRLPGHGTSVGDLERTTADDWYAAAKDACEGLLGRYEDVYVAGLSMGGLLAIKLAALLPVKKAALISTPIYVQDRRAPLLPLLRFFIRSLPKFKKNYHELDKYCISYDRMPTKPLTSLFALLKECKTKLLGKITIPCLVLQSEIEHTVKPKSARYIYENLRAAGKKLVWFKHSGHILTLDVEHEQVFCEIASFFEDKNNGQENLREQ